MNRPSLIPTTKRHPQNSTTSRSAVPETTTRIDPDDTVSTPGSDIDEEIERLSRALEDADGSEAADLKDSMVLCALPLADSIARRYGGRGIDPDDLLQVARLASVKAVHRYRPGTGPGFTAFAVPTIYGEIKRYFRDHGWAVRPPRRLQELRARLQAEEERLRHELLREPTLAELAELLECDAEEIEEAKACSAGYHAVSLDMPTLTGKPLADEIIGASCPSGDVVVRDALRRSVAALDDRQRLVVRLRFVDELTQSQIAERIGVSQMQVSRMLSRILDALRRQMDDRRVEWRRTG